MYSSGLRFPYCTLQLLAILPSLKSGVGKREMEAASSQNFCTLLCDFNLNTRSLPLTNTYIETDRHLPFRREQNNPPIIREMDRLVTNLKSLPIIFAGRHSCIPNRFRNHVKFYCAFVGKAWEKFPTFLNIIWNPFQKNAVVAEVYLGMNCALAHIRPF